MGGEFTPIDTDLERGEKGPKGRSSVAPRIAWGEEVVKKLGALSGRSKGGKQI